jgi:hypothetical protein
MCDISVAMHFRQQPRDLARRPMVATRRGATSEAGSTNAGPAGRASASQVIGTRGGVELRYALGEHSVR